LEAIVDAADMAYRRRFLFGEHPHILAQHAPESFPYVVPDDDADEAISVLGELAEAGGPDLH
jgi:hypothetical protein